MNYSEPLINQVTVFFKAVGCGVILGILYDVISFIRMIFGERKSVYVFFDTTFFLVSAVISFFFMVLYNSGQVRFNLMLAELFGGMAFHFSFGRYIVKNLSAHIGRVRKIISFLTRPLFNVAKKIWGFLKSRMSKFSGGLFKEKNIPVFSKKLCNIRKILLKNKNKSV